MPYPPAEAREAGHHPFHPDECRRTEADGLPADDHSAVIHRLEEGPGLPAPIAWAVISRQEGEIAQRDRGPVPPEVPPGGIARVEVVVPAPAISRLPLTKKARSSCCAKPGKGSSESPMLRKAIWVLASPGT